MEKSWIIRVFWALSCVDSLLRYHQEELGLDNITSMLMVRSAAEARRGNYAVAADVLVLPVWALSFGGRSLEFRDMVVTIEGDKLVPYAGNIGMALVNQFEKVAINFIVFE